MSTTAKSPEHSVKMGLGQIRGAISRATPEEAAEIRRQLKQMFGDAPGPAPSPQEVVVEAAESIAEDSLPGGHPQPAPEGQEYVDHSSLRRELEARKAAIREMIDRTTKTDDVVSYSAEIDTIEHCIEISKVADTIPVHMTKWANDGIAKGLTIHTCDRLDSPRPLIKFNLYRYQTDRPFRIAYLRWYMENKKKSDIPIFEIPLDYEAYCGLDGQFQGFAPADHVTDLVTKGRARRPRQ